MPNKAGTEAQSQQLAHGIAHGFGELTDPKGKHVAPEEASPIEKPDHVTPEEDPKGKPVEVEEAIGAIVLADTPAKPDPSVEELEASLLAGVYTKKHVGKSKGDTEDEETTIKTILKKPARATILKKPVALSTMPDASSVDLTGLVAKLRTRRATMDLKRFTSMAYHQAQTIAKHAGFSDDKAKAIARDASGKASRLFNEMGTY